MMNSGTIPSWLGSIMVATTKRIENWRPLNCSFAKANPAIAEKITCATATAIPTTKVLIKACEK